MQNTLTLDPLTLAYHELRSPLGLVATMARSVAEESEDGALRQQCQTILRTVERMLRTTGQVLDMAREGEPGEAEWFTPFETIRDLIDDLSRFDVRITVFAAPGADRARAFAAAGLFETLVQSLLTNAVDHSDPGADIRVELETTEFGLTLSIVNPVASSQRHRGIGAGLYLCERIAKQLGGTLRAGRVDSQFSVHVRMPMRAPLAVKAAVEAA